MKEITDFRKNQILIHCLSYLFFASCAFSAMWECGHPHLTLAVMLAIPVLMFSVLVPDWGHVSTIRSLIQMFFIGASIIWFSMRVGSKLPLDKALMELLCISGAGLGMTLENKYYGYQFLVSIILIIFGSMYPRAAFVNAIPAVFLSGILLLYFTRLHALSSDSELNIFPWKTLKGNYHFFIFHILLSLVLWIYFYSFFPNPIRPGFGFIISSFENRNTVPPGFDRWFKSDSMISSQDGKNEIIGVKQPQGLTKDKAAPEIKMDAAKDFFSPGDGQGSGQPGDDLVFTVASPLKLYWTAALYDMYDGKAWKAGDEMKKQKLKPNDLYDSFPTYSQSFIVYKWFSKTLYSAFMPESFYVEPPNCDLPLKTTFYNCVLDKCPPLPLSYLVRSRISCGEAVEKSSEAAATSLWSEKIQPEHYKILPAGKISARLTELVKDICGDEKDTLKRALLLRDYLRNNFKYRQDCANVPEGREGADYFIFDLKEGNCQYFGVSLTVLARIAGLPARLATGFSPGNFNILNGRFEVYEYHAHAWTQIFIECYGWLTFDATPPGAVTSKTTPMLIGDLEDPFGDDWRINPPEISEHTRSYIKENQNTDPSLKLQENILKVRAFQKMAASIPIDKEELKETMNKIKAENLPLMQEEKKDLRRYYDAVKMNVAKMLKKFAGGIKSMLNFFLTDKGFLVLFSALIMLTAGISYPRIRRIISRKRRKNLCLRKLAALRRFPEINPEFCIDSCYRLTREMLELSGIPRTENRELFEYGASITKIDPVLGRDAVSIFLSYSQMSFGSMAQTPEDASRIYQNTLRIKNNLVNNLKRI